MFKVAGGGTLDICSIGLDPWGKSSSLDASWIGGCDDNAVVDMN
jgi:hypothetical protein